MYSSNLNYQKLLDNFLIFKRDCGYKYTTEENIINKFYKYTQEYSESKFGLTKKFMENWATLRIKEGKKSLSNRVAVLREFTIHLTHLNYKVYILPPVRKARNTSFIPYIFSKDQIEKILYECDNYPISTHNRYNSNEVYPILFRLLYGCGLRISEALHLKIKDIDTTTGTIEILIAKNDKQRVIVMSDSLKKICHQYKTQYLLFKDKNSTFFQHKDGTIRDKTSVNSFFRNILYKAKIPYLGRGKGPYLHNLRHTFACHSFYQMHTNGLDMNVSIAILSTYLGHSDIKATERYLRLTQSLFPQLLSKVANISSDIYMEVEFEK